MSTFEIGPGLSCDLDLLVATRMLVQASSGQGKTRTIRRILEQTHGKIQQLVIDPEGEYATLREHFDYVLAAPKGGDVVAHPRYAKVLAEELLGLGVSAILDIYELNPKDRKAFVRAFLMALVDAKRDLWHPCLVVLDEAHVFCPERGEAESADAVEALATRGRKRGFCLIAATQRLAKFKKDAAAELANKLIGGTNLDIDIDRAGEELGFPRADRKKLRQMAPGLFYAFGRAFLVHEPTLVKVGGIKSKHPEPGEKAAPVPPPTAQIRKVLEKLATLPAEAEAREKSLADLQKDVATLKRELTIERSVEKGRGIEQVRVEVPVLPPEQVQQLMESHAAITKMQGDLDAMARALVEASGYLSRAAIVAYHKVDAGRAAANTAGAGAHAPTAPISRTPPLVAVARSPKRAGHDAGLQTPASGSDLTSAQRAILNTAAEIERRGLAPNINMVARWLKLHPNGGRYRGTLRELQASGRLSLDMRAVNWAAEDFRDGLDGLPVSSAQRAIVDVLDTFRSGSTIEEVAAELNLHPNGGRFRGHVRWLRTMGVITESGPLKLSEAAYR